jgi:hypothetical protein
MLKACKIYLISLVIFSSVCSAQSVYFNRTYDFFGNADGAVDIIVLDTGYLISGFVSDSFGLRGIGLYFLDSLGNEMWRKEHFSSIGGLYHGMQGSLLQVSSGGYFLTGLVQYPDFETDLMVWRFDENGDTLWTKLFKDTLNNVQTPSCHETAEGGFIITSTLDGALILMKLDSKGNTLWIRTGSYGLCIRPRMDTTSDGGYVIGGATFVTVSDQRIIKTDTAGNLMWSVQNGGPLYEDPVGIKATQDGGCIIYGDTAYVPVFTDARTKSYMAKYDSLGNRLWQKEYGAVVLESQIQDAQILNNGDIITTGDIPGGWNVIHSRIYIMKTNAQGDSLWGRILLHCYPGSGSAYVRSVEATNDGGYMVAGWTLTCLTNQDFWVIKTNCLGFLAPPEPHVFDSLSDPPNKTITFSNNSQYSDEVVINYGDGQSDTLTNPTWNLKDENTNVYYDTVNYITHSYPDTGSYIVTVTGWACGDIGVFTDTVYIPYYVGMNEPVLNGQALLKAYPNPFTNHTTIEFSLPEAQEAEVTVYALCGEKVAVLFNEKTVAGKRYEVDLDSGALSGGVYFYSLTAPSYNQVEKLILIQ